MRSPQLDLTAEQLADAERIYQALRQAAEDEHWRLAQLLASKPDAQLLGATEFEIRERAHALAAHALETAVNRRKKGGTKDRA